MSLRNWKHYHIPGASLDTFTRSEPFPSEEMKATYIDGKPKKKGSRATPAQMFEALKNRRKPEVR